MIKTASFGALPKSLPSQHTEGLQHASPQNPRDTIPSPRVAEGERGEGPAPPLRPREPETNAESVLRRLTFRSGLAPGRREKRRISLASAKPERSRSLTHLAAPAMRDRLRVRDGVSSGWLLVLPGNSK